MIFSIKTCQRVLGYVVIILCICLPLTSLTAKKTVDENQAKSAQAYFTQAKNLLQEPSQEALLQAKDLLIKVIAINPYHLEAFGELAMIFIELEDDYMSNLSNINKAFELARQIVELEPENPLGFRVLADLSQEVGQLEQAEAFIKRALHLNANNPDSLFVYGKILLIDRPDLAVENFKEALKKKKDFPKLIPYYILAIRQLENKEDQFTYLEELQQEVSHPEVLISLAQLYSDHEQYEKSLSMYEKYLATNSNNLRIIINIAIIKYLKLQKYESAITDLQKILLLPKEKLDLYTKAIVFGHLGIIEVFRKNNSKALTYFSLAIKIQPGSQELAEAISFAYNDNNQFEQSLDFYEMAIEIAPQNSRYHSLQGQALLQNLKRYREAIISFNKALELNPTASDVHSEKGFAHYYLTEYDQALVSFSEALKLNPENGIVQYNQGCVLSLLNREEEAVISLISAFRLVPELLDHAKSDPDLKNVRNLKSFQEILKNQSEQLLIP